MDTIADWWRKVSEIGIATVPDFTDQKLLRLQNRLAFFSALVVLIQTVNFYLLGFHYVVFVNLAVIAAYLSCLALNAAGFAGFSRFYFAAIAFFTIAHHHLYFGFASGFWLFLVNLTQVGFILFPALHLRKILLLASIMAAAIITFVFFTIHVSPFFENMDAELAARFFRNNLIRSPILLVLIAYYLVAENRRAESELSYNANKANEAANAKAFFLSNISHELRTPMNAIKGFSDILYELCNSLDDKHQIEFKKHLRQIRMSSANLTSIIDDLLDFARIDAGRIAFRARDFELRDVAENVMQTAEFYGHRGKGIETNLVLAPDLPTTLKGDPARLSQVLLNLVGNAMKFTHKGRVEMRIHLLEESPAGYRLSFEVEDTGIGIPGEKLPYLFDSLSPVSRETAVRYGGTGLGLAISKHLVEMQGGSITVMSSPGKGTLFTVDLWFEKGDKAEASAAGPSRDLKRAKILVAEDNDVNQILVQTLLESWNADIHIVENGLKALGEAQKNLYDLILMDLQMPFMDGIEACEQIRVLDDKKKSSIPIIALTADVLSETRKKVFAVGMNDIVTKPINQAELYAALRKGLNLAE